MRFEYVISNNENKTISARCSIIMKANVYDAKVYDELKETISKAIEYQSQMVVLSKEE